MDIFKIVQKINSDNLNKDISLDFKSKNPNLQEDIFNDLKYKSIFFTYTPGKNSTSWKKEFHKFDRSTIKKFTRKQSPYYGNKGYFRFISLPEIKKNE